MTKAEELAEKADVIIAGYAFFQNERDCEVLSVNSVGCGKKF